MSVDGAMGISGCRVRQDEAVAPSHGVMALSLCLHIFFPGAAWRHGRFGWCQGIHKALILLGAHGADFGGRFSPSYPGGDGGEGER